MSYSSHTGIPNSQKVAKIERLGKIFLRYGLTVAIGWIAAMKVTDYEIETSLESCGYRRARRNSMRSDTMPFGG